MYINNNLEEPLFYSDTTNPLVVFAKDWNKGIQTLGKEGHWEGQRECWQTMDKLLANNPDWFKGKLEQLWTHFVVLPCLGQFAAGQYEREYTVKSRYDNKSGRVDLVDTTYCYINNEHAEQPKVMIEVKQPGECLDAAFDQLLWYMTQTQCQLGIVTDIWEWKLYVPFAGKPAKESCLDRIDLRYSSLHKIEDFFVRILSTEFQGSNDGKWSYATSRAIDAIQAGKGYEPEGF